MKASKQLREKIRDILTNCAVNGMHFQDIVNKEFILHETDQILALLDSVREEYKGKIEGLRMEKADRSSGDSGYWYDVAVKKFNSKIDEVLKRI